jgi:hypothetical protein
MLGAMDFGIADHRSAAVRRLSSDMVEITCDALGALPAWHLEHLDHCDTR